MGLLKSFVLGLGLSSFFWLPALYDKQYTVFDKTPVSDFSSYFITLTNLNVLGMSFFVVLLGAISVLYLRRNREYLYFLSTTIILSLFVFPFTSIFWKYSPLTGYIQFPFRVISYLILGLS
ncbi:hypothetical protein M1349_02240, partial [Patescibacteria group bacterium]|nr:hypothetical protein [Patescibacteria group bacterium]